MVQTWVEGDPRRHRPGREWGEAGGDPQWHGSGPGENPHWLLGPGSCSIFVPERGPPSALLGWWRVVPPVPEPWSAEAAPALTWPFSPGCGGADGLRAPAELTGRLRLAAHLCAADSRCQDDQVPITSITLPNTCTILTSSSCA